MKNGAFAPEKCSIFHNIFKCMIFQRRHNALLWSKGLTRHATDINGQQLQGIFNSMNTNEFTHLFYRINLGLFRMYISRTNM